MKTISGTLVLPEGPRIGTIKFDDIIREIIISEDVKADIYYHPNSALIFPGFVDLNANYENSISNAALSGGVTQVCVLPNSGKPTNREEYDSINYDSEKIDIIPYGAIGRKSKPFDDIPYFASINIKSALSRYKGLSLSFSAVESVDEILEVIVDHNLFGTIHNISNPRDIEKVVIARNNGVNVLCGVAPHHLCMDTDIINAENKKFMTFLPPLASPDDRVGLIDHLNAGNIDFISSNHCPFSVREKMDGAFGAPHLDTFGQFMSYMIKHCDVPAEVVAKVACMSPGEYIGSFMNRNIGKLEIEYESSFVVLDFSKPAFDSRPLQSEAEWSPFDLRKLPGSVDIVYFRGSKMVDDQWVKN